MKFKFVRVNTSMSLMVEISWWGPEKIQNHPRGTAISLVSVNFSKHRATTALFDTKFDLKRLKTSQAQLKWEN